MKYTYIFLFLLFFSASFYAQEISQSVLQQTSTLYFQLEYQSLIKKADSIEKTNPIRTENFARILQLSMLAHMDLQDYKGALQKGEEVLNLSEYIPKEDYLHILNKVGFLRKLSGDYEGAIEAYDEAIGLDAAFFLSYINKANLLKDIKMFNEALATLYSAPRPQFLEVPYATYATCYMALDNIDSVEKYMVLFLGSSNTEDHEGRFVIAQWYEKKGYMEMSCEEINRAIMILEANQGVDDFSPEVYPFAKLMKAREKQLYIHKIRVCPKDY